MLVNLFWALLVASGSAVVVFWVFATKTGYDVLAAGRANGHPAGASSWVLLVAWPFAAREFAGAPADKAAILNKMMVGFIAAIFIVAASAAVYSNLTFVLPAAQTVQ